MLVAMIVWRYDAHRADAVLGDVPAAASDAGLSAGLGDEPLGVDAHSTRLRPVSRRKTSSRLDRRTSDVIGSSPASTILVSSASPFAE